LVLLVAIKKKFAKLYDKFLRLNIFLRGGIVAFAMILFVGCGAALAAITATTQESASQTESQQAKTAIPVASRPGDSNATQPPAETDEDTGPTDKPATTPTTTPAPSGSALKPIPKVPGSFSVTLTQTTFEPGTTQSFSLTINRIGGYASQITSVELNPSVAGVECEQPPLGSDSMTFTCTASAGVTSGSLSISVTSADNTTVTASTAFQFASPGE
jgi:hypothetical protein